MAPSTYAILLLVVFVLVVLGIVFMRRQTRTHGKWGIGAIGGADCPRCGTHLGIVRAPKSAQETMWGGWTCPNCGAKVDKYGKERAAA